MLHFVDLKKANHQATCLISAWHTSQTIQSRLYCISKTKVSRGPSAEAEQVPMRKETWLFQEENKTFRKDTPEGLTPWILPLCSQNPSVRETHLGQQALAAIWSTSP